MTGNGGRTIGNADMDNKERGRTTENGRRTIGNARNDDKECVGGRHGTQGG